MDASLRTRAEELAKDIASQAKTAEDFNSLMQLMMKSTIERILDTEMDFHLGRQPSSAAESPSSRPRQARRRTPPRRLSG